jgi:hypothetical protein
MAEDQTNEDLAVEQMMEEVVHLRGTADMLEESVKARDPMMIAHVITMFESSMDYLRPFVFEHAEPSQGQATLRDAK